MALITGACRKFEAPASELKTKCCTVTVAIAPLRCGPVKPCCRPPRKPICCRCCAAACGLAVPCTMSLAVRCSCGLYWPASSGLNPGSTEVTALSGSVSWGICTAGRGACVGRFDVSSGSRGKVRQPFAPGVPAEATLATAEDRAGNGVSAGAALVALWRVGAALAPAAGVGDGLLFLPPPQALSSATAAAATTSKGESEARMHAPWTVRRRPATGGAHTHPSIGKDEWLARTFRQPKPRVASTSPPRGDLMNAASPFPSCDMSDMRKGFLRATGSPRPAPFPRRTRRKGTAAPERGRDRRPAQRAVSGTSRTTIAPLARLPTSCRIEPSGPSMVRLIESGAAPAPSVACPDTAQPSWPKLRHRAMNCRALGPTLCSSGTRGQNSASPCAG